MRPLVFHLVLGLLLLFATPSFAQGDTVQLHLDYSAGAFNWSLVATSACAPPATVTGSIHLSANFTLLARHHLDSIRADNIYIVLDTVNRELSISVLNQGAAPTCGSHTCLTFMNSCGISFHRLPYTIDNVGSIYACGESSGRAHATYGGAFLSDCRSALSTQIIDSTWSVIATPCLSILVKPKAGMRENTETVAKVMLEQSLIFVSSTTEAALIIRDLLGRTIATRTIPAASLEFPVAIPSLPPGCYFVRLSGADGTSEVVKFVVAP